MAGGKADELSGVTALDDKTVMFTLTRPDATFLHVMAINFAFVVPKEEVEKAAPIAASSRSAPAPSNSSNGCRASASSSSATRTITRQGVPYLDKITFEIGQEPTVALLRLQKGEIDIVGDGIPPAKFPEVMADPEQQGARSPRATSCTPATSP